MYSFNQIAKINKYGKIISNPYRVMILNFLQDGAKRVSDIHGAIDATMESTSNNLRRMKFEGILESNYRGKEVYYSIKDRNIFASCEAILKP